MSYNFRKVGLLCLPPGLNVLASAPLSCTCNFEYNLDLNLSFIALLSNQCRSYINIGRAEHCASSAAIQS